MTEIEIKQRMANMLAEEINGAESSMYYLSFADDSGFLGCAIVSAFGPTDAVRQTHLKGINPGGEVMMHPIPNGTPIPDDWKNRLLSLADMERLGMMPAKAKDLDNE